MRPSGNTTLTTSATQARRAAILSKLWFIAPLLSFGISIFLGALSGAGEMPRAFFIQNRSESKHVAKKSPALADPRRTGKSVHPDAAGSGRECFGGTRRARPANGSADVEGLGAGRLTRTVERDLLDPGFGLAQ